MMCLRVSVSSHIWHIALFFIPGDVVPETPESVNSMCVLPEEVSHLLGHVFVSHTLPDCVFRWCYVEDNLCHVPHKVEQPVRCSPNNLAPVIQAPVYQAL